MKVSKGRDYQERVGECKVPSLTSHKEGTSLDGEGRDGVMWPRAHGGGRGPGQVEGGRAPLRERLRGRTWPTPCRQPERQVLRPPGCGGSSPRRGPCRPWSGPREPVGAGPLRGQAGGGRGGGGASRGDTGRLSATRQARPRTADPLPGRRGGAVSAWVSVWVSAWLPTSRPPGLRRWRLEGNSPNLSASGLVCRSRGCRVISCCSSMLRLPRRPRRGPRPGSSSAPAFPEPGPQGCKTSGAGRSRAGRCPRPHACWQRGALGDRDVGHRAPQGGPTGCPAPSSPGVGGLVSRPLG